MNDYMIRNDKQSITAYEKSLEAAITSANILCKAAENGTYDVDIYKLVDGYYVRSTEVYALEDRYITFQEYVDSSTALMSGIIYSRGGIYD